MTQILRIRFQMLGATKLLKEEEVLRILDEEIV